MKYLIFVVMAIGLKASDLAITVDPESIKDVPVGDIVRVGTFCPGDDKPTLMGYYHLDKSDKLTGHITLTVATQTQRGVWQLDPQGASVITSELCNKASLKKEKL